MDSLEPELVLRDSFVVSKRVFGVVVGEKRGWEREGKRSGAKEVEGMGGNVGVVGSREYSVLRTFEESRVSGRRRRDREFWVEMLLIIRQLTLGYNDTFY